MTDDRPPTTEPATDRAPAPGGHDDAEATIDVDPAWIASLRSAALGEAAGPRPHGDGHDDDVDGHDIESTIDASDELIASIRARTSDPDEPGDDPAAPDPAAPDPAAPDPAAPDLAHLPPPPTNTHTPPASIATATPEPAPSPSAAPRPAVRRWTPSDRLATRSALATSPFDDARHPPTPGPTPWKAIAVAVLVTAAVLIGAWAVFIRADSSAPIPPSDSEPVAPTEPADEGFDGDDDGIDGVEGG